VKLDPLEVLFATVSPGRLDVQAELLPACRREPGMEPLKHVHLEQISAWSHCRMNSGFEKRKTGRTWPGSKSPFDHCEPSRLGGKIWTWDEFSHGTTNPERWKIEGS
jgi:hypothetical protein